ncbi:response regulator [Geomonas sp. RF6]|uniref:response regulator n=1 Tax=Geomonas sp. RF6 TaxID=2897342 RepID=UPI001E335195|nr:response regulator [Geomonas sp. RF6]UFS69973.1 response regulator [Geomonas sp. RF6]
MERTTEILIIEDDRAEADLILEMLSDIRKEQFSVHHVDYLAKGLELMKDRSFDCILVDLGLPDSRGLESALSVRRQDPKVPIVVLTVLNDEESALSSLQLDIQDYLIKGEINAAVLTRAIRYARQRKAVMEELREANNELEASTIRWHMTCDSL